MKQEAEGQLLLSDQPSREAGMHERGEKRCDGEEGQWAGLEDTADLEECRLAPLSGQLLV